MEKKMRPKRRIDGEVYAEPMEAYDDDGMPARTPLTAYTPDELFDELMAQKTRELSARLLAAENYETYLRNARTDIARLQLEVQALEQFKGAKDRAVQQPAALPAKRMLDVGGQGDDR